MLARDCRWPRQIHHRQRGHVAGLDSAEFHPARVGIHELPRVVAADGGDPLGREAALDDQPRHERTVSIEVRLPGRALRWTLFLCERVGGVVGGQVIQLAVAERFEQHGPVGRSAQGRVHLHAAAVLVGDAGLIEEQMVRRDFAGDGQAPAAGFANQRQPLAHGVMAQFAPQLVLLDHLERELRGREFAGWRTSPLVRRFAAMLFEEHGILAVKADVRAPVLGQRPVELLERREIEVADTRPHIDFVRHGKRQRPRVGPDPRIERDLDRYVASFDQRLLRPIRRVVDRRGRIVRHVRHVHDAAMERRGRRGHKVFLVRLLAARIVAGMNVNVAHAGEDQAIVAELDVGSAEPRADLHDLLALDADLVRFNPFGADDLPGDDHGIPAQLPLFARQHTLQPVHGKLCACDQLASSRCASDRCIKR